MKIFRRPISSVFLFVAATVSFFSAMNFVGFCTAKELEFYFIPAALETVDIDGSSMTGSVYYSEGGIFSGGDTCSGDTCSGDSAGAHIGSGCSADAYLYIDNPPRLDITVIKPQSYRGNISVTYLPGNKPVECMNDGNNLTFSLKQTDKIVRCCWNHEEEEKEFVQFKVADLLKGVTKPSRLMSNKNKAVVQDVAWLICNKDSTQGVATSRYLDSADCLFPVIGKELEYSLAFGYSVGLSSGLLQAVIDSSLSVDYFHRFMKLLHFVRNEPLTKKLKGKDEYERFLKERFGSFEEVPSEAYVQNIQSGTVDFCDEFVVVAENDDLLRDSGKLPLGVICREDCFEMFPPVYALTAYALKQLREKYDSAKLTFAGCKRFIELLDEKTPETLLAFYDEVRKTTPDTRSTIFVSVMVESRTSITEDIKNEPELSSVASVAVTDLKTTSENKKSDLRSDLRESSSQTPDDDMTSGSSDSVAIVKSTKALHKRSYSSLPIEPAFRNQATQTPTLVKKATAVFLPPVDTKVVTNTLEQLELKEQRVKLHPVTTISVGGQIINLEQVCPFCSLILAKSQSVSEHRRCHHNLGAKGRIPAEKLHKENYIGILTPNVMHWVGSQFSIDHLSVEEIWGEFYCPDCKAKNVQTKYLNKTALKWHIKENHREIKAAATVKKIENDISVKVKVPEDCWSSVKDKFKYSYICPFCAQWCPHDNGKYSHLRMNHAVWVSGLESHGLTVQSLMESYAWPDYLTLCCSGSVYWEEGQSVTKSIGRYQFSGDEKAFKTVFSALPESMMKIFESGGLICPRCSNIFNTTGATGSRNKLIKHFKQKHSCWFNQAESKGINGNFDFEHNCIGAGFLTVLKQCYEEKTGDSFKPQASFQVYNVAGEKYAIQPLGMIYAPSLPVATGSSQRKKPEKSIQLNPPAVFHKPDGNHQKPSGYEKRVLEPPKMDDLALDVSEGASDNKTIVAKAKEYKSKGEGIPWDKSWSETYKPVCADTATPYSAYGVEYPFELKKPSSDPWHDPALGNVLSSDLSREYAVIRLIDGGSEAKVYYCRKKQPDSEALSRRYVIRVEDRSHLQVEDWKKRQVNLLRTGHLRHENLVDIYQQCFDGDKYYQVMEYLPQGIDELYGDETYLEDIEAWWITQAVVGAVNHLHQNGIAHRDVKPDNIRIGFDGRVRLFDYGIMKYVGDTGGMTKSLAYTQAAVAPMLALDLVPDGNEEVISNAYKQDYVSIALLQVRLHTGKWIIVQQEKEEDMDSFKSRARIQIGGETGLKRIEQQHIINFVEAAYKEAGLLKEETYQIAAQHIKDEIDFVIGALSYGLDIMHHKPILHLTNHPFIRNPPPVEE